MNDFKDTVKKKLNIGDNSLQRGKPTGKPMLGDAKYKEGPATEIQKAGKSAVDKVKSLKKTIFG